MTDYHAEYRLRRLRPPGRAGLARLKAMARRMAAPAGDDEAAMDDFFDLDRATERLCEPDQRKLDALLCLEMSRQPELARSGS